MKCSQFLEEKFQHGLYIWMILKFQHFVLWSLLEWDNVVMVSNTVKYYVMCQNANCLDHAVSVWVGNLVVPLLGLIKKEERFVVLLCRQKWWKVLKVTTVCVLSLRTVLFHTVCMTKQKCSRKFRNMWQMESTWNFPSMSTCSETLNCRSHRSGRQREGTCYRNCAGFKISPRARLCGTSFLNSWCRALGAIYWGLI